MAQQITCPRCGVKQEKTEKCIACGFPLGQADQHGTAAKAGETPAAGLKKKDADKADAKATSADKKPPRKKFKGSVRNMGAQHVKSLWLTPGQKALVLVAVLIGLFALSYFIIRGQDRDTIQQMALVHKVRFDPATVPPDTLHDTMKEVIGRRVYSALTLRGHGLARQDVVVADGQMNEDLALLITRSQSTLPPDEMTASEPVTYRPVRVMGSYTFKILGIPMGKRAFSVDGAYSTSDYDEKIAVLKKQEEDVLRRRQELLEKAMIKETDTLIEQGAEPAPLTRPPAKASPFQ